MSKSKIDQWVKTLLKKLFKKAANEAVSGPPASGKLSEYAGADSFDHFIRGWTKYWNDIFKPDEPLDPDLVKALIATESTFRLKPPTPNAGIAGKAHGLFN